METLIVLKILSIALFKKLILGFLIIAYGSNILRKIKNLMYFSHIQSGYNFSVPQSQIKNKDSVDTIEVAL